MVFLRKRIRHSRYVITDRPRNGPLLSFAQGDGLRVRPSDGGIKQFSARSLWFSARSLW